MIGLILGLLLSIEVIDEDGKELCIASNAIITKETIQLSGCNSEPPTATECITNMDTICKGEIDTSINGEYYNERIYPNKANVYTILPRTRDFTVLVFDYLTNPMTLGISSNPYGFDDRSFCTVNIMSGNLYISIDEVYGACTYSKDMVLYLRATSPKNGELSIFW